VDIAKSFRDLHVYREAKSASERIFELSRTFPKDERYSLTDQIRRSSRAVKAMIAEAWGRRRYKAVFVSKLDEALGEATETQSWLDDANHAEYLSPEETATLNSRYIAIAKMLSRMIDRADDFCKHVPSTDYRTLPSRVEENAPRDGKLETPSEFFS
jgi:four helix bundle protein